MKVYDEVEKALKFYPSTRNSDAELVIKVWQAYGLYLTAEQQMKLMEVPMFESIRRTRQKIQNEENKYQADEPIKEKRHIKSLEFTQKIPTTKEPERLWYQ